MLCFFSPLFFYKYACLKGVPQSFFKWVAHYSGSISTNSYAYYISFPLDGRTIQINVHCLSRVTKMCLKAPSLSRTTLKPSHNFLFWQTELLNNFHCLFLLPSQSRDYPNHSWTSSSLRWILTSWVNTTCVCIELATAASDSQLFI